MRTLLLWLLPLAHASPAEADSIPAPLACLARHYPVQAVHVPGSDVTGPAVGWHLQLPDGRRLPLDDGRTKTFAEKLAEPDVEDAFSLPYRAGPITPVEVPDHDTGRIRLEPLLDAVYGRPPRASALVRVPFLDHHVRVHHAVAAALERVAARLQIAIAQNPALRKPLRRLGGAYHYRRIAGTDRVSAHGYGIALDLAANTGHYWRWDEARGRRRWQNRLPQAIVDAFEAEGFIWGGRWYHYDTFHFEYRPELLDPACPRGPA